MLTIYLFGFLLNWFELSHNYEINASVVVTDKNGIVRNTFLLNEQFIVTFKILNSSGSPLHYSLNNSGPFASFKLTNDKSEVISSNNGGMYLQVIRKKILMPGEEIIVRWIGPYSSENKTNAVLIPGQYKLQTNCYNFNEVKVSSIEPTIINYE